MNKKDFQILELMAQNCRIPNTTIAQAMNTSKDTVAYKIKNLEKEEWIKQYVLFIDSRKLGFTRYHILIKFDSSVRNKQELFVKIASHKSIMWINSFIGRFDSQIIIDAYDGFDLNRIKEELFTLCDHKIQEYLILTHLSDLEFTQLNPVLDSGIKFEKKLDHSFSSILTTRRFPVGENFETYNPSAIEIEILKLMADNPRISLIEMSKILKTSRITVKERIKNLIIKKVILNFGGIPNLHKMGFVTYYLLVRLNQNTPIEIMKKPFHKLRNIFYAGRMIGDYDMILYLNARNPKELDESIEQFKTDIGNYIMHYDLLVQDKVHHWRQYTEGIYDELKNTEK
ncbi:MAG: Lrp/AsnC family transcriptional regulator [Candidatus Woesearchaeota archaeon]